MPPEAMTSRNSNCRRRVGSMTGWAQRLQGMVSKSGRSPGIQLLALHAPQIALRSVVRGWLESSVTGPRYRLFGEEQVWKRKILLTTACSCGFIGGVRQL